MYFKLTTRTNNIPYTHSFNIDLYFNKRQFCLIQGARRKIHTFSFLFYPYNYKSSMGRIDSLGFGRKCWGKVSLCLWFSQCFIKFVSSQAVIIAEDEFCAFSIRWWIGKWAPFIFENCNQISKSILYCTVLSCALSLSLHCSYSTSRTFSPTYEGNALKCYYFREENGIVSSYICWILTVLVLRSQKPLKLDLRCFI